MLHRLEFGDRLAELLALAGVLDRMVERALRQADHLRADADAPLVERFDRNLVALADLAEDVVARHGAVLEQQLARAAGADPELVFLPANREARKTALHEKGGDSAVTGRWIHRSEHDDEIGFRAVGDPQFPAGEPPIAAALDCAGREREGVAAGTALRERVGADGCRREARQVAAALAV